MSFEFRTNHRGERELVFYGNKEQIEEFRKIIGLSIDSNKKAWYEEE